MIGWLKRKGQRHMAGKVVGSLLRHLVTAMGAAGFISDGQIEQIAGALAVIGMTAWSIYQKYAEDQQAR